MLEATRPAWREFLATTTLARRAGCPVDDLAIAAAKEILDNALDASPAGIEVEIGEQSLRVIDRGPGLAEAKIVELFAVSRDAISSKRWRQARRGALGNGLRVVVGVAHCSGGSLIVESRGLRLTLGIAPDGSARIVERGESSISEGTAVTLIVGDELPFDGERIETLAETARMRPASPSAAQKPCRNGSTGQRSTSLSAMFRRQPRCSNSPVSSTSPLPRSRRSRGRRCA